MYNKIDHFKIYSFWGQGEIKENDGGDEINYAILKELW
jgi:hypothetical protein